MKFAYSTSVFRLKPLQEAIDGIARAGFGALELIADRPHVFPEDMTASKVTELSRALAEKKLRITNLNSALVTAYGEQCSPSWVASDPLERDKRVRYTLSCLRLAAAMGIPNVSTDAGPGNVSDPLGLSELYDLYVEEMGRILPVAKKLSVRLLIQPEPDALVRCSEDALKMLTVLKREHDFVGINFDAGHFYCVGEDPCQAFKLLRHHVYHVSLADVPVNRSHRHIQLGEGGLDIQEFVECLHILDYTGYVTIKLDCYDQRAEEIAMASARYLRDHDLFFEVSDRN